MKLVLVKMGSEECGI